MFFKCWNKWDGCWFRYESEHPKGSAGNRWDAVRAWNRTHAPYWQIGFPCVTNVSACRA